MSTPPQAIPTQLLGTLELEARAARTPVEHVAPAARVKAVHACAAREGITLAHEAPPRLHILGVGWHLGRRCGRDFLHGLVVVVVGAAGWIPGNK